LKNAEICNTMTGVIVYGSTGVVLYTAVLLVNGVLELNINDISISIYLSITL